MVSAATTVSDDIAIANKEMETIGKQQKKKDDIGRKQKEDNARKQEEERKKGEGVSSLVQAQLKRSISLLNSGAATANSNSNNSNNLNPLRDGNGQIHCCTNFDKDDANIDNRSTHNAVSAALTTSRKSPAPAGPANHRKRTVSATTLQQSAKKRKRMAITAVMANLRIMRMRTQMMTKTIFSSYVALQMRMMLMLMMVMVMLMLMQS